MRKNTLFVALVFCVVFSIAIYVSVSAYKYFLNQSLLQIHKEQYVSSIGLPVEVAWKWNGREIIKQGVNLAEIVYKITVSTTNEAQKKIVREISLEETTITIYFKDRDNFKITSGRAEQQKRDDKEVVFSGSVWVDKILISRIVDLTSTL